MSKLEIVPLGGMGNVTQNMFLYIYDQEILIVDCGIGFPDVYSPGVDVLIPDTFYLMQLLEQGKQIVGMILTHGHDDHIGALPYILPELPGKFPIFGSPLTVGFAEQRTKDVGVDRKITVVRDEQPFTIGTHFTATAYPMTHSVPDTKHYTIGTPEGVIYHGSDFKLDKAPVDGVTPDYDALKRVGDAGVLCMLIDCLRVERDKWTESESTTGPAIEKIMSQTQGKFVMTLMSSHIHRIQQTVNAAKMHKRKMVFIGRSVEQNVEVALRLGLLDMPRDMVVDKRDQGDYPEESLCVIIAGSQGQEGSSLVRAIYGEHRSIQITEKDTVVFSADAIPGNEIYYYAAIDELSRNGVHVLYPDVIPELHRSGHASAPEQLEMVNLIRPEYIFPIGGADRHRMKFEEFVAEPAGYTAKQVILPKSGEVIEFSDGKPKVTKQFEIRPRMVDGKGVGDVGPAVLADRRALSQSGIVVVVIPRALGHFDLKNMLVVSRGFVFMKDADEVIQFIKTKTAEVIGEMKGNVSDQKIKQALEKRLSQRLYKIIQREPVIVPVIFDV
jgi:ribonuclease J